VYFTFANSDTPDSQRIPQEFRKNSVFLTRDRVDVIAAEQHEARAQQIRQRVHQVAEHSLQPVISCCNAIETQKPKQAQETGTQPA